jgi:2-polyprenyl-6-methoxyphenol hydroxylase-like FAD-dependent oxidoreductase
MANNHAIVIGGSMAGLCTARVLSDFFARVTVIDRDAFPAGALERPGVPQSRHVHALLARGLLELDALFNGFRRTMLERGANPINFSMDFAALRADGWAPRRPDRINLLFASRLLIEAIIRELLRKIPNVAELERTDVIGLVADRDDALRVRGVRVRPRDGGAEREIAADLVVDASGRTSKSPAWLRELGLEPPPETVVDSYAGYSSRWFNAPAPERRPPDWWWKGIWLDPKIPEYMNAGVLFPLENNRWLVTLAGIGKQYPPNDEAGFMAMLDRLRSPILAEAVRLAEPISPVYSNRSMANRWRRYEKWNARLDGFIALGDAVCAFNPVYGQGMTSGAVSATILRDCLKLHGATSPELPPNFFKALARFAQGPWSMATGADFAVPETEGERPRLAWLFGPVMQRIMAAANDDEVVRNRFGEVFNMLKPPSALFTPPILSRSLLATLRRATHRKSHPTPIPSMPPPAPEPART